MKKNISAIAKLLEFCKKEDIEIKLMESQPQKEENCLLHIPGVKIIVSYKTDGPTS
jgi:hypothetical protein